MRNVVVAWLPAKAAVAAIDAIKAADAAVFEKFIMSSQTIRVKFWHFTVPLRISVY